jgi:hypothetical protein
MLPFHHVEPVISRARSGEAGNRSAPGARGRGFVAACDSATCYVSSRDRALKSSGIVHAGDRAGLTPPLTLLHGIDTIDTSDADLTFLGHGNYAEARPVLTDMHGILHAASIGRSLGSPF